MDTLTEIESLGLSFGEKKGLGSLLAIVAEPGIRDVLLQVQDGKSLCWADRGGGLQIVPGIEISETRLREMAVNLVSLGGRHLDELEPFASVQLGKRLRVHAALSPMVAAGAAISIRVAATRNLSLMELLRDGLAGTKTAKILFDIVHGQKNFLISGATASGKTTLLKALLSEVPEDHRIITIEDVSEILLSHPHHLALEARQANSEGAGEITLDRLLQEALRMRPDRIVLGECRGGEIATLLTALNTGHDGGASTIHANSLHDVPARLEALGSLAGLSAEALARQAVSAIDTVIHVVKNASGHKIAGLGRLVMGRSQLLEIEEL